MLNTFLEVLPLAIGATINPTGLLFVMMILSEKDNSKLKALSFVLGSTLFLILLGIFIFFTFKPAINSTNHPNTSSAIVDIVLGLIIILIVIKSVFFKKKVQSEKVSKKRQSYTLLGFLFMIVDISSLIPFIAATKIIANNKLNIFNDFSLVFVVILISMLMMAFPVIVTYIIPKQSEKILGPIKIFMSKNGSKIANVYFLLMAIYLIYRGVVSM